MQLLRTSAYVMADAAALLLFLRAALARDGLFKPFMLALPIAITTVLCLDFLYSIERRRRVDDVEQGVLFLLAATQLYVAAVGSIAGAVALVEKAVGAKEGVQAGKNKIIIIFSFIFVGLVGVFFVSCFDLSAICGEENFWACVGATALSLLALGVAGRAIAARGGSEALQRKIFHAGPILVVPIVHSLNERVLVLILAAGFAGLLLLEVVRYHWRLLERAGWLEGALGGLFGWMGQFNTREHHFWFTHLFLALSLLAAYLLPTVTAPRMKLPAHLVLVLVAADALAAVVGVNWGRLRIYGGKTLEGSAAFMAGCFVGSWLLVPLNSTQLALLSAAAAAAELFSGDADNIATLLTYYGLRLCFILVVKWRVF